MNIKVFGWWLILLGVLGGAGTGIGYLSLKGDASHAYGESVMGLGTSSGRAWHDAAREAERTQERLVPWMIGCGAVVLIGAGMCFAGGGASGPTKTCPQCAETVLAAAVVCKHCGAKLAPQQSGASPGSSYRALATAAEEAERRASRS